MPDKNEKTAAEKALRLQTDALMENGRCRMHGGKSTGPRTAEGLERCRRANWKHGRCSAEAVSERKEVAAIRKAIRLLISEYHSA